MTQTYSLFKRTSHQGTQVLSIHSVSGDCHQMTFTRHYITQQCQMSVIHIRPIERYYRIHFLLHGFPHRLDSKNAKYFADVIRVCTYWVH